MVGQPETLRERQAGAVRQRQTQMAGGRAQPRDRGSVIRGQRDNREGVSEDCFQNQALDDLVGICASGGQPREHLGPVDRAHHRCLHREGVAHNLAARLREQMRMRRGRSRRGRSHRVSGAVFGGVLVAGVLATFGDQLV